MKNFTERSESILTQLFLITLPWQTRWIFHEGTLHNNYWEYASLSLYAIDIIIIAIIILQMIRRKSFGTNFLLLSASLAAALTSIYISSDKILTLFHLAWLILATGIVISLKNSFITKKQLVTTFVIGCAVAGFLGIYQFTSQKTFSQKWLGLAMHDSAELGTSVVEATAPDGMLERWMRAYGPLDHPNILGGLMALGLIFAFWLAKTRTDTKNSTINIITILAMVGLSGGLIVSFSRSAWLAASVGIIILLFFEIKKSRAALQNLWLPLLTCVFVATLFAIPYYYLVTPRIFGDTRLENKSAIERVSGLRESWTLFKKHPMIGSGLGNYGLALERIEPKQIVWFYQPVHNIFALLLTEIGIFGTSIFLLVLVSLFLKAWRHGSDRALTLGLIGACLMLMLFDHWLVSLHAGILIGASTLGLMLKNE